MTADNPAALGITPMPDGKVLKPRHGVIVAFRGVGAEPAERLAAADKFGAVLYGGAS